MKLGGLILRIAGWILLFLTPVVTIPAIYLYFASGDSSERLATVAENRGVESVKALRGWLDEG